MVTWRKRWSSASWQGFLAERESDAAIAELRRCTHTGRPLGTAEFVQALEQRTERRLTPVRAAVRAKPSRRKLRKPGG